MMRHISVIHMGMYEGRQYPHDITYLVAHALGRRLAERGGICESGCGMDMGFHIVNSLSCELFCPDKYDHDSAYALKQEWL
jgi:hypothetical protein